MKNAVRTLLVSTLAASLAATGLCAQAVEEAHHDLQKIDNICAPGDIDALGLICSEDDPCPVYLELSSVQGSGPNIFISGNLHTRDVTMFGVLLASDDSGRTWTEPARRIRNAGLEQIQFADSQHGWVSGVMLDPLPRAPFLLSTANGGQQWHKVPLSADAEFGSIQQFFFESANRGQLIVDRSQGKNSHYDLYSTTDGGETWTLKATTGEPMRLPGAEPESGTAEGAEWRSVPSKDSYEVQRHTISGWDTVARFPTRAGECK